MIVAPRRNALSISRNDIIQLEAMHRITTIDIMIFLISKGILDERNNAG
jgi:hypothetical protein